MNNKTCSTKITVLMISTVVLIATGILLHLTYAPESSVLHGDEAGELAMKVIQGVCGVGSVVSTAFFTKAYNDKKLDVEQDAMDPLEKKGGVSSECYIYMLASIVSCITIALFTYHGQFFGEYLHTLRWGFGMFAVFSASWGAFKHIKSACKTIKSVERTIQPQNLARTAPVNQPAMDSATNSTGDAEHPHGKLKAYPEMHDGHFVAVHHPGKPSAITPCARVWVPKKQPAPWVGRHVSPHVAQRLSSREMSLTEENSSSGCSDDDVGTVPNPQPMQRRVAPRVAKPMGYDQRLQQPNGTYVIGETVYVD